MLSKSAFNALLKTLEEPPAHVKFVFATTEIRKVPVTVLSRCQRFDLRRLDQDVLAKHLGAHRGEGGRQGRARGAGADRARRRRLGARRAVAARPGDRPCGDGAVGAEVVRDMLGLADRGRVLDLFERLMQGDVKGALAADRRRCTAPAPTRS